MSKSRAITGALGQSCGIVFLKMVALKTQNVSDEELTVLRGQADEASVQAIHAAQERKWIQPQHFDRSFKGNVIWEEKRKGQDVTVLVMAGDHDADAAGAEVDGCLDQLAFCFVSCDLQAHGQRDGDAIKLAAFSPGWL